MMQYKRQTLILTALILYLYLVVRTAWISDDAYITARVIENFIHGYGPVYNVGERVQAFTHPLWFLILSLLYGFLVQIMHIDFRSQMYFFLLAVSIFVSGGAIWVLLKYTFRSSYRWLLPFSALVFSRTFIDFSTSGLEYPLFYLLMALLGWRWQVSQTDYRLGEISLWIALLLMTRPDTLPLLLPIWLWEWVHNTLPWRKRAIQIVVGFAPWLFWEIFAIIYYGFPFPNTYYAKVGGTFIPTRIRIHQGLIYFLHTWDADPVTVFAIVFVFSYALFIVYHQWDKKLVLLPTIGGILLYLVYVIYVGGDFMQGRFLLPAFFLSIIVWERLPWPKAYQWPMIILLALLGSTAWYPVFNPQGYLRVPSHAREKLYGFSRQGIADERLYYMFHPEAGGRALIQWKRQRYPHSPFPDSPYRGLAWRYEAQQHEVVLAITIGTRGYALGPSVHVVDVFALVDPLLARLPAVDKELARPGHIFRAVPAGYLSALETGDISQIRDAKIREYYRHLFLITRGPLFSKARWIAMWKINTGQISPPPAVRFYQTASEEELKRFYK